MENKKLYIGLGVLAVAGIGFYLWKKNQEVTEGKSNAIGRRNLGVSKGNLGGGIVNIPDPKKMCCPDGKPTCTGNLVRCPDIVVNEPKDMPKDVAFTGSVGSFGNVSLGTNIIQAQQTCDAGKKWCNKRQSDGTYKEGCFCNEPIATTTTTTTKSGVNGYMNSVNNPMYKDLTLLVDPANY